MAPWTVQERMTLHVLFGYYELDFYGPVWWALHRDITKTERTERTCREDYKYSHGKERTQMYPRRILKPYHEYDAEERAAYDKAFQNVINSARRQGITLHGSANVVDDEGEETNGESEEDKAEKDEHEEDVEMTDASEGYTTAQEDNLVECDAVGDDGKTREVEVEGDFQMEDEAKEEEEKAKATASFKRARQMFFDQPKPKVLAESEFPATPQAKRVLITAIGAREIYKKAPTVSAVPARNTSGLLATVSKVSPTIAAPLSPAKSIAPATPAASNPALPSASSSGGSQKRGRGRPKKQKVELENELAVTLEASECDSVEHDGTGRKQNKKVEDEDLSNSPPKRVKTSHKPAIQKTAKKPRMYDNYLRTSKKPISRAHANTSKPVEPSTRDQLRTEKLVKPATAGTSLTLAQVANQPQVINWPRVDNDKYDAWRRTNLDRLLFGEPYNMLPNQIKVPGKRAPPQDPLTSDERVINFFIDMFDGKFTKKVILSILKKEPDSDSPGRRLKKIYKALLDNAKNTSTSPRYLLTKVFSSAESPFSNFRLASDAFGQGLKMLHMSDLDYTGVGNQQLVAFAKFKVRHFTVDDIEFISPDDPVFKRGGRVHKLWIRQQECPILGESKKYNSAHICMDIMICQEAHCPKCSKDKEMGADIKPLTSLPRVHRRHITRGDEFVAPLLKFSREYEKDFKDEFIIDVNVGVQSVKLWDGTTQDVVVCDRDNCPGCFEAFGGIVEKSKDEREKADRNFLDADLEE